MGYSQEFAVQIQYGLAIQDKATDAAVLAFTGPGGKPARTLEVAKDPSKQYPFRETELVAELNDRLGVDPPINRSHIQAVAKAHAIQGNRMYFYRGQVKGSPGQYSRRFADWFVTRHRQSDDFIDKAREKVRQINVKARAERRGA